MDLTMFHYFMTHERIVFLFHFTPGSNSSIYVWYSLMDVLNIVQRQNINSGVDQHILQRVAGLQLSGITPLGLLGEVKTRMLKRKAQTKHQILFWLLNSGPALHSYSPHVFCL